MVGPTYNRALEVRLDRQVLHINKSVLDLRCIDSGLLVAVHTLAHFSNGLLDVGIINRTVVCGAFTYVVLPSPTPFLLLTEMRLFA